MEMENNMTEILETAPAFVAKADYDAVVTELNNVKAANTSHQDTIRILNNRIASFKEEIKQFVVDNLGGLVDDNDLRELAETFDIELTQEISFTATVTFNVTATVALGTDLDDLASDINLSAELSDNYGTLENFDYDYHEVEISDVEVM